MGLDCVRRTSSRRHALHVPLKRRVGPEHEIAAELVAAAGGPGAPIVSTSAAAALLLLMLTDCLCSQIVTLKCEHVDLEHDELRFRQAKIGARAVPLSPAANQVLTTLPRRPDNPWVSPGRVRGTRLRTLNASWQVVRKEAGLEEVRLHHLRHSSASYQQYPAPVSVSDDPNPMIPLRFFPSVQAA